MMHSAGTETDTNFSAVFPSLAHEAGPWAGGGLVGELLPPAVPVVALLLGPGLARAPVLLLPRLPVVAPAPLFVPPPPVQGPHRQGYTN